MWGRIAKKSVWNYRRLLRLQLAKFESENEIDWVLIAETNERVKIELNE